MASTSFVDLVTLTAAAWFNDVDIAAYSYLTSVSGTNTIVGTGPVPMGAYAAGQRFRGIAAATNTGATTLNITPSGGAALGAKNIFCDGAACVGGEITISTVFEVVYDGTQFNLVSKVKSSVYDRVVRTAGNVTTTSTSLVDVTGATVTFTTKARPVLVGSEISHFFTSGAATVYFNIDVDGTADLGTGGNQIDLTAGNKTFNCSFAHQTAALTAASHTIKLRWSVSADTGNITANSTTPLVFWAHEI